LTISKSELQEKFDIEVNGSGEFDLRSEKSEEEIKEICESVNVVFDSERKQGKVSVHEFIRDYLKKSSANPQLAQRALNKMEGAPVKSYITDMFLGDIGDSTFLIIPLGSVMKVLKKTSKETICPEAKDLMNYIKRTVQADIDSGMEYHVMDGNTRKHVCLEYLDGKSTTKIKASNETVLVPSTLGTSGEKRRDPVQLNKHSMSNLPEDCWYKIQHGEEFKIPFTIVTPLTFGSISRIFKGVNSNRTVVPFVSELGACLNGFRNQIMKTAISDENSEVHDRLHEVYSGIQLEKVRELLTAIGKAGTKTNKEKDHGLVILLMNLAIRMFVKYNGKGSYGIQLNCADAFARIATHHLRKDFKLTKRENKVWQNFIAGIAEAYDSDIKLDLPRLFVCGAVVEMLHNADSSHNRRKVSYTFNNFKEIITELWAFHDEYYELESVRRYTRDDVRISQDNFRQGDIMPPLNDTDIGQPFLQKKSPNGAPEEVKRGEGYWYDSRTYIEAECIAARNEYIAENFLYANGDKVINDWIDKGYITEYVNGDDIDENQSLSIDLENVLAEDV